MIGEIDPPGFLEGGDFFPAGRDLALVGIGLRSNFEACRQLMERDLLGTRRLAIVRDEYEQHQARRCHLIPAPMADLPLHFAAPVRHPWRPSFVVPPCFAQAQSLLSRLFLSLPHHLHDYTMGPSQEESPAF